MKTKWTRLDWLGLVALLAGCGAYMACFVNFRALPFEDAAILMRYSQHLAGGHGIVWNVGEPPVEGATDFLFMAAAAGLVRLGVGVELAVRCLVMGAHLATGCLVYAFVRSVHGTHRGVALALGLYLLIGRGLTYFEAYFGTPVFALAAAGCWYLAHVPPNRRRRGVHDVLFAVSALVMALIRPEGVFLAALILASVAVRDGLAATGRALLSFAAVFAVLGGAYFLWRWRYFGYPLPNPYYKKAAGQLYTGGLGLSVGNVLEMSLPVVWLWLLGLRPRR